MQTEFDINTLKRTVIWTPSYREISAARLLAEAFYGSPAADGSYSAEQFTADVNQAFAEKSGTPAGNAALAALDNGKLLLLHAYGEAMDWVCMFSMGFKIWAAA